MIRRKKQSFRPNAKFYIFLGAVAAAVVLILFFVLTINTVAVEQGSAQFETQAPVVVVRDEQVIAAENYEKASYLVPEGERVEADTPVAEVYKWGYIDKVMNDLIDVETKIQQYQENNVLSGVSDPELDALNTQIAAKAEEIRTLISSKTGDVIKAQRELTDLMAQKQDYLKGAVTADQQLDEFYSQEQQLQERVNGWREVMSAPEAGVVSFYFDGNESLLNADNIKSVTSETVRNIIDGTAENQLAEDGAAQPLYRLVNNFKWYILIDSQNAVREFANGNTFAIVFDDYPDRQFEGTVVGNVTEDGQYVYVVEISEDIGSLLNTRRADAKIYTTFEGLKVPEESVKEQDGQAGVYVVIGREKTFVPVEVKIVKDGSAIISPIEEGTLLAAGQHIEA